MYLYIVRHGEPDYETDTLTERGKVQAELVAKRLMTDGIDEIFSSPQGRAKETAAPLARMLGLPVNVEEWAHEMDVESETTWPDGQKKLLSRLPSSYLHAPSVRHLAEGECIEEMEAFRESGFAERWKFITEGSDGFLARLGYERTPDGLYAPTAPNDRHIALFCHCGMGRVLLSHFLHLPFHHLASTCFAYFTGITVLWFDSRAETPTVPLLISYGDAGHLFAAGEKQYMKLTGEFY